MEKWPELLRVKELCKFLGRSKSTVYQIRQTEGFPKPRYPTGKTAMYVTEEVREWVKGLK